MATFGDVLGFDPEQLQEIFRICTSAQGSCTDLHGALGSLTDLSTWNGPASKVAKETVGTTRVDIDSHGQEVSQVGAAARDCYDEGVSLRKEALDCQQQADTTSLAIDPASGTVTDTLKVPFDDSRATMIANLQSRVNGVVTDATRFDEDLAVLINGAGGRLPLTPWATPNENELDRRANEIAAFRAVYHRDPTSENDWRMADALDTHTYDPKFQGVKAKIVMQQFDPISGAGLYRQNLYIPSSDVHNVFNPFDAGTIADFLAHPGLFPENRGDMRGPSSTVPAEDSRVSIYADMDNGILLGRQNPTVSEAGEVKTGTPTVYAVQGNDGSLAIQYSGTDALAPPGGGLFPVEGDMTLTPTHRGDIAAGGNITSYPSAEAYQYKPDGTTTTLFSREATMSAWGPMVHLPLGEGPHVGHEVPSVVAEVPHSPDDPPILTQVNRPAGHVPEVTGPIPGAPPPTPGAPSPGPAG